MNNIGFCVHAHFYQPSREDPITGKIPEEVGAFPYKNWNELIFNQCYLPNTELEVFKKISFNFGPTLFNWMEIYYPDILKRIIDQERTNYLNYGLGNALAQPYHHTILPLMNLQDKITQVYWGIEEFKYRFGHAPAGMWLPETAVDLETLQVLADHHISFTILAPWQVQSDPGQLSPAYKVQLKDNKTISIVVYQRNLSTQVSFNPLSTVNADVFAHDFILPAFHNSNGSDSAKYILVASDGELYGHHQPFRDKFLAHLMNDSLSSLSIQEKYPALWLKEHELMDITQINENTSWSCHHGISRWSSGCDCSPNSNWKHHLRTFITKVNEIVTEVYEKEMRLIGIDPWGFRNQFIDVLLKKVSKRDFVVRKLDGGISEQSVTKLVNLLSAQVEQQRMQTSCGWFFEDFQRIEPQNAVAYATHAIYLTSGITGIDYKPVLEPYLREIKSQSGELNGLDVYNLFIQRYQMI